MHAPSETSAVQTNEVVLIVRVGSGISTEFSSTNPTPTVATPTSTPANIRRRIQTRQPGLARLGFGSLIALLVGSADFVMGAPEVRSREPSGFGVGGRRGVGLGR